MASIFSRIIAGEIPCHRIAENKDFLAFLDIQPVAKGHTLVIPKQEIDYYFDLSPELIAAMSVFAREIAPKIKKVVPCKRIGVSVIGLEVPHAHMHLIPINSISDMDFTRERVSMTQDEFSVLAEAIRQA